MRAHVSLLTTLYAPYKKWMAEWQEWASRATARRHVPKFRVVLARSRKQTRAPVTSGRVGLDVITSIGMRASMLHHHQRITIPTYTKTPNPNDSHHNHQMLLCATRPATYFPAHGPARCGGARLGRRRSG